VRLKRQNQFFSKRF